MRTEVILAKPLGCSLKIKAGEKIVSIEFVPQKHKQENQRFSQHHVNSKELTGVPTESEHSESPIYFPTCPEKIDLPISREITRYFEGEIIDFSNYEVDLGSITSFEKKVLEKTRKIRYGQRLTYSELAGLIGTNGIRAVGNALAKNPVPIVIPCHRVVAKKGLGGYSGGAELKKKLLKIEEANMKQLKAVEMVNKCL